MSFPSILRTATLFVFLASPLLGQDRPPYLGPKEIMDLMEKSTRKYEVEIEKRNQGILADPFETLYPDRQPFTDPICPVEMEGGRRWYEQYPMSEEMMRIHEAAEENFGAGRYAEARERYLEVIALDPKFYMAYSFVGDTYFQERDPERALAYYDTAVALNPNHHQAHYFRASALRVLGRVEESRQSLIRALARFPRHESTFTLLRSFGEELGIKANEVLFMPRGLAFRDGDKVRVVFDQEGGAPWLGYAMAKAMWLGEPEHREAMTGTEERLMFSTVEETECLLALVQAYMSLREKEEIDSDERLDRLVSIIEEGYLTEFLLYELGTRVSPHYMFVASDEARAKMEEFVGRFVIVDR